MLDFCGWSKEKRTVCLTHHSSLITYLSRRSLRAKADHVFDGRLAQW